MIIKAILIIGIAAIAVVVFRPNPSARGRAAVRGLLAAVLLVGTVGVLQPALVTSLANSVGVGRGTDLLLYLLAPTFGVVSVSLYGRLLELENRFAVLTRRLAIAEARMERSGSQP
jgi:small membrane protein